MRKLIFLALFALNLFANQTFCYNPEKYASDNLWEMTVENEELKTWIKKAIEKKEKVCIDLSSEEKISQANEVVQSSPTSAFYFKY